MMMSFIEVLTFFPISLPIVSTCFSIKMKRLLLLNNNNVYNVYHYMNFISKKVHH